MNLFSEWKDTTYTPYKVLPVPPVPLVSEPATTSPRRRLSRIEAVTSDDRLGFQSSNPVLNPKAAVSRERWSLADERACTARCKRCGGPIQWAKVIEDTADPKAGGRWMPMGPDLVPHSPCGGGDPGRFPKAGTA